MCWLGLGWDEPVLIQSQRTSTYQAALDDLRARDLAYACFCTRADIAQSLTAPHGDAADFLSRHLPYRARRSEAARDRAALLAARFGQGAEARRTALLDREDGRSFTAVASDIGDAILARKDAPASYHLSCVVDDAASGVTMVVRGADLHASTPIQRLLQELLGLPEPVYFHHPLVTHEDGRRLAKRDLAPTLAAMRETGVDGRALTAQLLAGEVPSGFRFAEA